MKTKTNELKKAIMGGCFVILAIVVVGLFSVSNKASDNTDVQYDAIIFLVTVE